MNEPGARGTLGTVRNAVLLLDLLSEGPAYQQLTDLAERSGLSVPTVHRLLRSLVVADLVEQDPVSSRYGLGKEVARLAQRYLARQPLLSALSPYLVPLRDAIGQTVYVAVLVRGSVVYVDRVDGTESTDAGVYRDIHRVHTALATAAGRILAARATDDAWRCALEVSDGLDCCSAETERASWRRAGYLVSGGATAQDAGEIAVPVTDGQGRTVAALAASSPPVVAEAQAEHIAAHLTRAGSAAGRSLGHG